MKSILPTGCRRLSGPRIAGLNANLLLVAGLILACALPVLAQPVVTNATRSVYARVTDPQRITFAPDGTLYTGRDASGSGGGSADAVKVTRVAPGGTPVSAFGNAAIADPDAVAYDTAGAITGTPGALIVGGATGDTSGQGRLSKIASDGTVTSLFGPSSSMLNPNDFTFDAAGRLLFTDPDAGKVWRMTNATPVVLVSDLTQPSMIALDALGRIVLSFSGEERLRLYSATGALLSNNFVTARSGSPLARGPGGAWGTGIYYLDPNGKFISVDTNGNKTIAGSGFEAFNIRDLEFGPDGALYASDFDNDRIFRFAQPAVTNATTTIYARVADPQILSFAPDGALFVGRDNSGSGGGTADAVKIHRIAPGGSPVTEYGNAAIADPDAVAYDASGKISGTAGAVIVGGVTADGSAEGRLSKIMPDGTISTLFGPSSSLINPGDFVFDAAGRLLFVDGEAGIVWVMTNATPRILVSGLDVPSRIAVDSLGRILVSVPNESRVHLYSATGASINDTFIRTSSPLALGPGGFWGTGVFCVNTNGDLLTVDVNGNATKFGTGFGGLTDFGFGPDGALYASDFQSDLIWRIASSAIVINQPPSVNLTSPANNTTFTAPATIVLDASASDADGTITSVEFFSGSAKLGEDTTVPYSFTWQNVVAGSYSLTAKATDDHGGTATAAAISVEVTSAGIAPTITREPSDQVVEEGDAVVFSVSVHGSEPLKYQWNCDGTPIPGATAAVLELLNVLTNQAGLYTVAVSNASGSATSQPTRLVVSVLPADQPRLAIGWTEAGLTLDSWLRNKQGFFSILQSDRVAGLAYSSNILISAPIPLTRRSSRLITNWVQNPSPARFFQVREERAFTNSETKPYFSQTIAPSAQSQTIDCGQGVKVQIPGGVLSSPQPLTVCKLLPNPLLPRPAGMAIGSIFEISLGAPQTFATPLTIEIPYEPELLNPELQLSAAVTAAFWHPVENVWSVVAATADPQRKVLTVKTRHLSFWASAYTMKGYRVLTDPQEQIMIVFHPVNKGVISGDSKEPRQEFDGEDFARKAFEHMTNALSVYRRLGFTEVALPAWAFLDPAFTESTWSGKSGNIYLPTTYTTTAEFRGDAGHELFHQVQNSYYYTYLVRDFGSSKWWHEACAEYAGYRLAGGSLPPFQWVYFLDEFLQEPLTTVNTIHEYGAANFLDYVFTTVGSQVTFKGQFDELTSSSLTETVIDRLDAYVERRTSGQHLLRTLYLSFADEFYLNKSGLKPYLDVWSGTVPNEKPGATLLTTAPIFEHTFELKGGYTAKVLTMRVSALTDQAVRRLRVIYADGPGDDSGIVRMFINAHEPRFADAAAVAAAGWTLGAPGTSSATNVVEVKQDDYITIIACNTYSRNRSVTVVIEEEPAISLKPSFTSMALGDSCTLKVTVEGLDNEEVKWSILEGADAGELITTAIGEVSFKPSREGQFHVVATSVADPSLSAQATVDVIPKMLEVTIIRFVSDEIGPDEVWWTVTVQGGVPPYTYYWEAYDSSGSHNRIGESRYNPFHAPPSATTLMVTVRDAEGHVGWASKKL